MYKDTQISLAYIFYWKKKMKKKAKKMCVKLKRPKIIIVLMKWQLWHDHCNIHIHIFIVCKSRGELN